MLRFFTLSLFFILFSITFYHYKIFDSIDKLDSSRISFTFNNIGNTLLKKEKYKEEQPWIQMAVKLNMKDGDDYSLTVIYTNL